MLSSLRPGYVWTSNFLALFVLSQKISAAKSSYCSEINTSSGNSNSSVYQSNGLCTNFCIQDFAFAILQDQNCWCSNYIPPTTTTGCTLKCPGYPFESCGGDELYEYIALGNVSPSGTLEASPTTQTSTTSVPHEITVTTTPIIITQTENVPRTSSSSSSESSSSSSSPTPITSISTSTIATTITNPILTPTPTTSIKTISGSAHTVTILPTTLATPLTSTPMAQHQSNSGLSTGAAVGLTASLVAIVAFLCSMIYLYLRKQKDQNTKDCLSLGDQRESIAGLGGQIPSRTMSENSRYVLGTDGRRVVEAWEFKDDTGPKKGKMVPVDPRLDPFASVYRIGENKSRESLNTLHDDYDYSRRVVSGQRGPILRATNPD
ncbi:hypothetical protein Golomagni_00940 [Golovinomyces magnicellulatus]|nr:hypothetical protein Golomagni_00940 [Golovinomyces magnicellulatus]